MYYYNSNNSLINDLIITFPLCLQADEMSHVIAELEKSISRYKEEYASLISQAQAIKADLAAVEAKVICPLIRSTSRSLKDTCEN